MNIIDKAHTDRLISETSLVNCENSFSRATMDAGINFALNLINHNSRNENGIFDPPINSKHLAGEGNYHQYSKTLLNGGDGNNLCNNFITSSSCSGIDCTGTSLNRSSYEVSNMMSLELKVGELNQEETEWLRKTGKKMKDDGQENITGVQLSVAYLKQFKGYKREAKVLADAWGRYFSNQKSSKSPWYRDYSEKRKKKSLIT